jgi:hypothetical protein
VVVVVVGEHTEGTTQHKPSSRHAMHLRGWKSILYAPWLIATTTMAALLSSTERRQPQQDCTGRWGTCERLKLLIFLRHLCLYSSKCCGGEAV